MNVTFCAHVFAPDRVVDLCSSKLSCTVRCLAFRGDAPPESLGIGARCRVVALVVESPAFLQVRLDVICI